MGVDLVTYRIRIGRFNSRGPMNNGNKDQEISITSWFVILVLAALLIIGGIEANPGPDLATLEEKINLLTSIVQNHSVEINKKIDNLNTEWKGTAKEVTTMRKEMEDIKERMQNTITMERDYRNHNIIIFGLGEQQYESKFDTVYRVLDLFTNELHLNMSDQMVANAYWIGRRRGNRPLLVRFTSVLARDQVLERTRMLKGTRIRVDRDYDYKTRVTRRKLLQYMWNARREGSQAYLVHDKIRINGKILDLEFCEENIQLNENGNHSFKRNTPTQQAMQRRERSYSPQRTALSQQERSCEIPSQRENNNPRPSHSYWKDDDVARRPDFRIGEFRESDTNMGSQGHVQGNLRELNLQTITSPQGSIMRVDRNTSLNRGNYNLRNWVIKKP